jgi:hypothetical protein
VSDTTRIFVPRMKKIAKKMLDVLETYPSTPYTKDNLECLDQLLFLIERAEGEHQGEHYGSQKAEAVDGGVREGHGEGEEEIQDW